nr:hypothetical protein [Tanacetum cinerariifolium]
MSSPNHPTSDIEDAFFSPNYTSASLNYSPASSGNTPSESLNNSYGLVPIASPTLSLFHDDLYMKVMHAYPMLSPIFNPQKFFAPEELLPLKIKPVFHHSPLLICPVYLGNKHVFMPPKRTSTSIVPAMNQAAIWQLIDDHVAAALEAQAANMENIDSTNRNPEQAPIARKCSYKGFMSCQPFNFKDCKVKFATATLTEEALSWGNDLKTYVRRFQELATLCPTMVSDSEKMMEAFIGGLPRHIEGNVTASKPQTLCKEPMTTNKSLMIEGISPMTTTITTMITT